MEPFAENRKARHDYEILETLEAGVELLGHETKSIRAGHMNLVGAYAVVRGGELWLLNASIPPYQPKNVPQNYDATRTRRLLVKRKEISSLLGGTERQGLTIVPLRTYAKHGMIKIELGIARSKKKGDKRAALKKRAMERESGRRM